MNNAYCVLALTAGLNVLLHIASEQRLKGVCETHNVLGEKFKCIQRRGGGFSSLW